MTRRLFTFLAALSLLLCVAVVVLWVRSYVAPDAVAWTTARADGMLNQWSVHSARGWIGIEGTIALAGAASAPGELSWESGSAFWAPWGWPAGAVRYWHLVVYTGALPLVWWTVLGRHVAQRRYRGARGLCLSCGYDLRATPERCPECGAEVRRVGVVADVAS